MRSTIPCLAVLALVAAGCDDIGSPAELDRARILAVRVDPPHLAAGEVGRLDVLVGGDDGRVAVVAPQTAAVPGAPVEMVVREGDTWQVRAPGDAEIAALRVQLGLPADALVPVPLAIDVTVGGELLTAEKSVHLGAAGANPTLGDLTFAGAAVGPAAVVIGAGAIELGATAITGAGELAYAWYSSVGDVERYGRETATLTALAGYQGQIVFVVRDDAGGVVWRWVDVVVQ